MTVQHTTTDDISTREWCPACWAYTHHDERWYERHQMEVLTCCACNYQADPHEREEWGY